MWNHGKVAKAAGGEMEAKPSIRSLRTSRKNQKIESHFPSVEHLHTAPMDSGISFPFDRLPIDIQSRILSLLPISTLALCRAVSRSWRSLISSPAFTDSYPRHLRRDDLIFLLFSDSDDHSYVSAYLPSRDRWIRFPFPPIARPVLTGTSLILAEIESNHFAVLNPFSRHRSPHPIPLMDPLSYVVALIEHSPSDYKIVTVSTAYNLHSNIYHSRAGQWEPSGELARRFAVLGNAVYLDSLLFCLSRGPDHLLTFDPVGGEWTVLDLDMPLLSIVCSHILVFGGELHLAAGAEEDGVIARICIWKLDRGGKEWNEVSCLPQGYLDLFGDCHNYFEIVDKEGMVCFYNRAKDQIVMCDLAVKRWWLPKPCGVPLDRRMWFGQAIEPHAYLLK